MNVYIGQNTKNERSYRSKKQKMNGSYRPNIQKMNVHIGQNTKNGTFILAKTQKMNVYIGQKTSHERSYRSKRKK